MGQAERRINVELVEKFHELLTVNARYKIYKGGRGGAKSWNFAKALIVKALSGSFRILCTREFQVSIKDSVMKLLTDQIHEHELSYYFDIQKTSIKSITGSEFMFAGIKHNIESIKSIEGIDICWVEEAQTVSDESWEVLIPTIRKEGSEIWLSFNPRLDKDSTYQRFVVKTPPNSVIKTVNWQDNPYFPKTLRDEMEHCRNVDIDAYNHIWGGHTKQISDAVIFKGKYRVDRFEAPEGTRFYYGADWGFSVDPTVLIRCFILGKKLFVDYEAYGVGVELDSIPDIFDLVPGSRDWPIYADNSRPETISYIRRKGFMVHAATKWNGSVEDGISYLRNFEEIVIHERCKNFIDEAGLYAYKTDKNTNLALPEIVDKHNHCWDACRYSQEGNIQKGGLTAIWENLI